MNAEEVASEIAGGFATAWNRHDMEALGRLFHGDAGFVNIVGVHMRGRESIQAGHGAVHAGAYRNSSLGAEVEDAREIRVDVIVAHVHCLLQGDERAPGQTRHSRMTLVIEQRAAEWRIVAAHNTAITTPVS
jgi:uncharacterized protein (TIGR02246 family)